MRRQTPFFYRHDVGFTLLEVVVAVAIFGVIASIVFPALLQFLDMRDRVEEKHDGLIGLQKTFIFLANDLRYAVARTSKDEYGEPLKTTISLDDDALMDFVTVYPDLNLGGLGVPRRVVWKLEEGALIRQQYPVMDPDSDTRVIYQLLLENIRSVEVEVSSIKDGRDETDDKWEDATQLPNLLSIIITTDDKLEYKKQVTMQSGERRIESLVPTAGQQTGQQSGQPQDVGGDTQ